MGRLEWMILFGLLFLSVDIVWLVLAHGIWPRL